MVSHCVLDNSYILNTDILCYSIDILLLLFLSFHVRPLGLVASSYSLSFSSNIYLYSFYYSTLSILLLSVIGNSLLYIYIYILLFYSNTSVCLYI